MNNTLHEVIKKIVTKTRKKEIPWKASIKNNCYEFSTSNMTIKLEKILYSDPFGSDSIIFSFADSKGIIFEKINAIEFFSSEIALLEFYELVERQVNKIDEKLNILLNELDDISPSM